ncbi:beta-glucosidase A [Verticillium alfalfae VaMs.102]|uniref:Beta-glucosidase A n=1 Tax=Verticillium alfalfae (strain VaMs.102 / ATCC MYA-4576 / FGSC 10136) TaxID=526221 RepID=C9S9K1_VERA1|nr:beta-glucosidase A [Verticillium alfalfae VaMs.102]EEY16064.1 beta-glucosidase A [Verticillium alfalfae VaMs.102]
MVNSKTFLLCSATMMIKAQLVLATLGAAQQVYLDAEGPTPRPQCKATRTREPEYTFTPFSHTLTDTVRYATSVPPATTTETYAEPSESLTSLVTSLSYTTWGKWDPRDNSTATAADDDSSDPYGQAAWTALWRHANPPNFTETSRGHADEGKSPSLMDILVRDDRPKSYVTNENYYYYKQDIERVAAMGVSRYAFSIAWTRILPFALPGTPVNQAGIDHYNDVINFILEKGMTPEVTLLHFDTPLQFFGSNLSTAAEPAEIGYVNGAYQNETFPAAFVNYAKIVLTHYADRVPVWYTYNEPLLYANNGKSIDHVIKSHAEVYHFYKEQIKGTGLVSLRLNNNFGVPRDPDSAADVYAAEHFNTKRDPPYILPPAHILPNRPWPNPLECKLDKAAHFTTIHYTATVVAPPTPGDADSVRACAADAGHPLRPYCVNQTQVNRFGWNVGYRSQSYVYTTPVYLRSYLGYVWNTWRRPVVITEFGFPVFAETDKVALADQLFDTPRSNYYLSYLTEVLKAIWEDGVDVAGAYAWSFADNWEFGDGASNFGIQTVNRTSQVRNYKKSFFDLVDFVKARGG